ncbi:MAG: HAMP domain-containing histidine kinase [Lachnospiraceae bacterium]|nr:HAMP domain-containing histidine kinase [Lachnospiraceae bacterium]
MKQYSKVITIFCAICILGIIVFALFTGDTSALYVDTVTLHDITQKAGENFDLLQSLDSQDFGVGFVVLSNDNKVLYASVDHVKDKNIKTDAQKMTLEKAIKNRYPYMYIKNGETVKGTVVMLDSVDKGYAALHRKMILGLSFAGMIILIGALLFRFYIKKNIIVPFERMETFAGKVAEGKLDEPLMMEENNMFGKFTESFDIMREELAASKERELALQRKEKELVASLSHDLKTPITGIKLTTELLQAKLEMESDDSGVFETKDTKKDTKEKLDNIYKKADQIDALVSDLFTATLDDLGEFKVHCQDEESLILSEIIRKHDDRNLALEGEIPKVIINVDSKRMNQVIGNILVNSYKYAETGIDVSYQILDEFLEMKIRDFGPGIPEGELELVTNKFYRGKNAEGSQKEGSGLGLYIAKSLMEKMNGELMCENGKDKPGFMVTLLIPLS